jgi:creatinine amidohydrolase
VNRSLYELTSPQVAELIGRTGVAVLPFGSTEQHGPHLPCGTDTMAAELIAAEVAEGADGLYVPFGPFGVTPIHAGHPGTVSLTRATFESLITDICTELIGMGVSQFVFVNWHEGNIASLNAVATDLQSRYDANFIVANACYVAQRIYREAGGELTHGGGIETLAILAYDGSLADVARAGESTRPPRAHALDEMRRSHEVYGFITDVTEIDPDGWYGDPRWATEARAGEFAETVAGAIMERLTGILELRGGA